jgi:predicted acylesterase/phospholipase RssA
VLCGGGITGLAYEIGALRALDDLLVDLTGNDFDIYVGTSAGSIVGALLANGVSPSAMAMGLSGTNRDLRPPTQLSLYRPNVAELAVRMLRLPRLVQETIWELARHPGKLGGLDFLGMFSPLLPTGIFDHSALGGYLENIFSLPGLTDDFRELDPELHIVACAVDSDERVVFSRFHNAHVPISRAAAASSALPVLFRPIRIDGVDYIDGGIKGNASIDVAVEQGATPCASRSAPGSATSACAASTTRCCGECCTTACATTSAPCATAIPRSTSCSSSRVPTTRRCSSTRSCRTRRG